jgi:hypothetical protein
MNALDPYACNRLDSSTLGNYQVRNPVSKFAVSQSLRFQMQRIVPLRRGHRALAPARDRRDGARDGDDVRRGRGRGQAAYQPRPHAQAAPRGGGVWRKLYSRSSKYFSYAPSTTSNLFFQQRNVARTRTRCLHAVYTTLCCFNLSPAPAPCFCLLRSGARAGQGVRRRFVLLRQRAAAPRGSVSNRHHRLPVHSVGAVHVESIQFIHSLA